MVQNQLKQIVKEAVQTAYPTIKAMPVFSIATPNNRRLGDYATNLAFVLARHLKKRPMEIAGDIVKLLNGQMVKNSHLAIGQFSNITIAKPGFINFYLSEQYLQNQVQEILEQKEKFGRSDLGKDLKVNIEFISANPTGPLTLGNARGGFYGDTLANVFSFYGAKVEREYFINDRGQQIQLLGASVQARYLELCGRESSFPVGGYQGDYILDLAKKLKKFFSQQWVKAEKTKFADWALAEMLNEIRAVITKKMKIHFDHWFSERALYLSHYHSDAKKLLNKLGLLYEKDSALWLKTTALGADKDEVLRKSNGEYTYLGSDIPYHLNKISRGYHLLINVFGADNANEARRLKLVVEEILSPQINWGGKIVIPICQMVRLVREGQEIRLSKRKGVFVTIEDLLEGIPLDVARFFFLMRSLNTHMDFDFKLAKEHSEKNPVYYVQYAYARIHSILAKSKILNTKFKTNPKPKIQTPKQCMKLENLDLKNCLGFRVSNFEFLKHLDIDYELNLIKTLIKLPDIIAEIVEDYQVNRLTSYARELADNFHNFYENCRVIDIKKPELTQARLALCLSFKIVLKNTLNLMGISAPKRM